MNQVSTVAALRDEVTRHLQSQPALSQVTIIKEDKLNIPTLIAQALTQGKGFCITVLTGSAKAKSSNLKPAQASVESIIEVAEMPALNRTKNGANLPAIDATVIIVEALQHFQWCQGRVLVLDEVEFSQNDKIKMQKYTIYMKTDVSFETNQGA